MVIKTDCEWLTLSEAASLANVHYETLRAVVRDGPFTRRDQFIGRTKPRVFVLRNEVLAWVDGGLPAVASAAARRRKSRRKVKADRKGK